jgi:hypothetical protein
MYLTLSLTHSLTNSQTSFRHALLSPNINSAIKRQLISTTTAFDLLIQTFHTVPQRVESDERQRDGSCPGRQADSCAATGDGGNAVAGEEEGLLDSILSVVVADHVAHIQCSVRAVVEDATIIRQAQPAELVLALSASHL